MRHYLRNTFFLLLLLATASIVITGSRISVRAAPIAYPPNQQNELPDLDLVLLIDESGSVWFRTDPEQGSVELDDAGNVTTSLLPDRPPFRIEAAQLLVNMLAAEQRKQGTADHTVSAYLFGRDVVEVTSRTPVAGNASRITEAIRDKHYEVGATLFWTDIDRALEQALEEIQALPNEPGRRSVIVLITDGRPETETANLQNGPDSTEAQAYPDYLEQIKQTISQLDSIPSGQNGCPGSEQSTRPLYLLGVDQEALTALAETRYVGEEYENFWEQPNVVGTQYRPVRDFPSLSSAVTLLTADLLCARGMPLTAPLQLPQNYTFDVKDNYASVMFTIVTSAPNVPIAAITPPDAGTPISQDSPGVKFEQSPTNQVWSIDRSSFPDAWEGTWNVYVEGPGTVQFGFLPFAENYRIGLLAPMTELHPAGKPLDIVGQVLDAQEEPYREPVQEFAINYGRETAAEPLSEESLTVGANDDDTYQARIERPQPGQYTINMEAEISDNQVAALTPAKTVSVRPLPWPILVEPRTGTPLYPEANVPVRVSAQVMGERDSRPRKVDDLQAGRATVTAELRQPGQDTAVQSVEMEPVSGDPLVTHQAMLTGPTEPGSYELLIRLEYPTGGGVFTDTTIQTFQFQEPPPATEVPPTPTATPEPPEPPEGGSLPLLPLGALGVLGAGGAYWYFALRGPKLNGARLLQDGGGALDLTGKRHKLQMFDSNGTAEVQIRRVMGASGIPETMARVAKFAPGQKLTIGNQVVHSQGQEIPLKSGSKLQLDGSDSYEFAE